MVCFPPPFFQMMLYFIYIDVSISHHYSPLTVFINGFPLEMDDANISRILECCGKLHKLYRPKDPALQIPTVSYVFM